MSPPQRVKICGITDPEQGQAIARCGATALGFICVPASPRYVEADRIAAITRAVTSAVTSLEPLESGESLRSRELWRQTIDYVGVFANASPDEIVATVSSGGLTSVQLHGSETPADCRTLRAQLSANLSANWFARSAQTRPATIELIKAFRVRSVADLTRWTAYADVVDTLLLDAYHPDQLGGTGQTLDWAALEAFAPGMPWLLAGGLNPDNVGEALARLRPTGIDLSSGVERSPGDKDLERVVQLFCALESLTQN